MRAEAAAPRRSVPRRFLQALGRKLKRYFPLWTAAAAYLLVIWALPHMIDERRLRQKLQEWGTRALANSTDISIGQLEPELNPLGRARLRLGELRIDSPNPDFETPLFRCDPLILAAPLWGLGGVPCRLDVRLRGAQLNLLYNEAGHSNLAGLRPPADLNALLGSLPLGRLAPDEFGVELKRSEIIFDPGRAPAQHARFSLLGRLTTRSDGFSLAGELELPPVPAFALEGDQALSLTGQRTAENDELILRLGPDSPPLWRARLTRRQEAWQSLELTVAVCDLTSLGLNLLGPRENPGWELILGWFPHIELHAERLKFAGLEATAATARLTRQPTGVWELELGGQFAGGELSCRLPGWRWGDRELPVGSEFHWRNASARDILGRLALFLPPPLKILPTAGQLEVALARLAPTDAGGPTWRGNLRGQGWDLPAAGVGPVFASLAAMPRYLQQAEALRCRAVSRTPPPEPPALPQLGFAELEVSCDAFADGARVFQISGRSRELGPFAGGGSRIGGEYRAALTFQNPPAELMAASLSEELRGAAGRLIQAGQGLRLDFVVQGANCQVTPRLIQDLFRAWTEAQGEKPVAQTPTSR